MKLEPHHHLATTQHQERSSVALEAKERTEHEATLHEARNEEAKKNVSMLLLTLFSSEETPKKLIADIKDL